MNDRFTMNITPRDIVPMKLFNLLFLSIVLTYSGLTRSEPSLGDFSIFQSAQQAADDKWDSLENGMTIDEANKAFAVLPENNTVWGRLQKEKNGFSRNCLKALPHVEFCRCLSNNLLPYTKIEFYIAVSTENDVLLNSYFDMSPFASISFKKIKEARNKCSALVKQAKRK